jgi:hypothetical protein
MTTLLAPFVTKSAASESASTARWYSRATDACFPFIFPESRFRMRWTGDELVGPLEAAQRWLEDNPSPDNTMDAHLRAMLGAYREMPGASVPRMMELRNSIEYHAQALVRRLAMTDTR